jgi:small subunit ribosomal protein S2
MSNKVEVKELLEAGVHFGHMTRKWDPNMVYYMERNGITLLSI